jgi:hypothetical protein
MTTGVSGTGGGGGSTKGFGNAAGAAADAALAPAERAITRSCSSKYSPVILSSELEGTLAAEMPNSLALARTNLLSKFNFLAIS